MNPNNQSSLDEKTLLELKSLLIRNKIKQKEIASELGLSHVAITGALNGHWNSEPVLRYVAKRVGKDYDKLRRKAA